MIMTLLRIPNTRIVGDSVKYTIDNNNSMLITTNMLKNRKLKNIDAFLML